METQQSPRNAANAQDEPNDNMDVITSLVNREIYTLSGLFVGDVHDVRLDFNSLEVSHIVVKSRDINPDAYSIQRGKDGILIPYRWVRSVGDIILINDIGPRQSQTEDASDVYTESEN